MNFHRYFILKLNDTKMYTISIVYYFYGSCALIYNCLQITYLFQKKIYIIKQKS